MPNWSETTTTYKVGTVVVLCSVCLFIIGFGTPFWFRSLDVATGLWQYCTPSLDSCSTHAFGVTGYFDALRVFQILALIALLIGVIMLGVVNIFDPEKSAGVVVAFIVTGGILGIIGAGMYGLSGWFLQAVLGTALASLSWSFYLNTVGSILAVIFGIVVAVSMTNRGSRGHIVNPAPRQMQVFHTSTQQSTVVGVQTTQQQPGYGQVQGGYTQQPIAYGQIQQPPAYWQTQAPPPGQQTSSVSAGTPPPANYEQPPGYGNQALKN